MLVLSRKKGQELIIGDNIRIYVSRVTGNRVTLGIEAPQGVNVVRAELSEIVRAFGAVTEEEPELTGAAASTLPR
jgi:carbon storage regulator CsrA